MGDRYHRVKEECFPLYLSCSQTSHKSSVENLFRPCRLIETHLPNCGGRERSDGDADRRPRASAALSLSLALSIIESTLSLISPSLLSLFFSAAQIRADDSGRQIGECRARMAEHCLSMSKALEATMIRAFSYLQC